MPNSKKILKIAIGLGVCSFLVIGLFQSVPVWTSPKITDEVLIDDLAEIDVESLILPTEIESRIPSLPIAYWRKYQYIDEKKSPNCAKYPSIFDLEFNNIYWQTLRSLNGTFQLLTAYYDIREASPLGPTVRIIGMIDRIEPTVETFCQFWFDDRKEPIIVKTFEYRYIWQRHWGNYKQGIYQPYLITCKIPKILRGIVPSTVSIVEKECDTATNNLRVIYNPAPELKKKGFAVCVKGLDFLYDDISVRLVEWIELLNILGVEKIYFYELQVHPNMSKILQHYEQEGLVHVTPLTLAGSQPNVPGLQHLYLSRKLTHKRQNDIIAYNDCLYKNMYMYDLIAVLDIDEVIIPKQDMTWRELMERVLPKARLAQNDTYPNYNVKNVYFLNEHQDKIALQEDIPEFLAMLKHVNRAQTYTNPGVNVKGFHNPELVLSLRNQFPLLCLKGGCGESYPIDTEDAQMHHYCENKKSCEKFRGNPVNDTTIWKYKDKLMRRTVRTLDRLGFKIFPFGTNGSRSDLLNLV